MRGSKERVKLGPHQEANLQGMAIQWEGGTHSKDATLEVETEDISNEERKNIETPETQNSMATRSPWYSVSAYHWLTQRIDIASRKKISESIKGKRN